MVMSGERSLLWGWRAPDGHFWSLPYPVCHNPRVTGRPSCGRSYWVVYLDCELLGAGTILQRLAKGSTVIQIIVLFWLVNRVESFSFY